MADQQLYCTGCGEALRGSRFCTHCGAAAISPSTLPAGSGGYAHDQAGPVVNVARARTETPGATDIATPRHSLPKAAPAAVKSAPASPAPASVPPGTSDRSMLIGLGIGACVLVIALAVALYVGGVFSGTGGSSPTSTSAGRSAASVSGSPVHAPASPAPPSQGTTAPDQTTPNGVARVKPVAGTAPATLTGPSVTGQDQSGYNTGSGCSDDPSSSLPGCNDSPTTPNQDSEGPCPNGITIDSVTTSCSLAERVRSAYSADGQVAATAAGRLYHFLCQTGGSGTTGYTFCESDTDSGTLYLRWHG